MTIELTTDQIATWSFILSVASISFALGYHLGKRQRPLNPVRMNQPKHCHISHPPALFYDYYCGERYVGVDCKHLRSNSTCSIDQKICALHPSAPKARLKASLPPQHAPATEPSESR